MAIVICPGMHATALTDRFLEGWLGESTIAAPLIVIPVDRVPAYSGWHIVQVLSQQLRPVCPDNASTTALMFIGFSAGVVGAVTAAQLWQQQGGRVKALVAIDGWGVPLFGNFPVHRLSHDFFTHWSSAVLGSGLDSFYADPAVEHLDLWRSPQTASGWWVSPSPLTPSRRTTAASFLSALLAHY